MMNKLDQQQRIESSKLGKMILEGFVKPVNFRSFKFAFIACGQFGGRLGDELARLGNTVIAFNTAESDLNDLKDIPKSDRHLLKGFGGSAKNLKIGQQTIFANNGLIKDILQDDRIIEADYVFVIAGLGGGTGNSAIPLILGGLAEVRKHKKISGKPTHGAIISTPGDWEPRGMKENALYGIDAISKLHKAGHCGAAMVLDNTKLKNTSTSIFVESYNSDDWRDVGNYATASMITEVTSLLDLPSSKSFDRAEFLDVISTPGFFSMGKISIKESIEKKNKKQLIEEAILNSPTADGYNYNLNALNGFMSVVSGIDNKPKFISDSEFINLEAEFFDFIRSASRPHSGYAEIPVWSIRKANEYDSKKQAIIYVGIVTSDLPPKVKKMIKEVQEFEAQLKAQREKQESEEIDLSKFSSLAAATKEETIEENPFNFFSMTEADSDENKDDSNDFPNIFNIDPDMYK